MLAWHLSGGTTELLLVRPQGTNVAAEKLGGTSDISAGQLIDRTGVLLGLQFPAGKALDELYPQADACMEYRVKLKDLTFSLSGMENQVKRLLAEGEAPANVARFTLDTVCSVVLRATQEAQRRCPGLPVLCSGGVDSTYLMHEAHKVLGDKAMAVTMNLASVPEREVADAMEYCTKEGIRQKVIKMDQFAIEGFAENPTNRCYLCKHELFEKIWEIARENGMNAVAEGSNMDDNGDYRPGLIAVKELGVSSPLRQAEL